MSYRFHSATTCVLALALATLPLRLAAHIHPAGIEGRGRALVHAHLIQIDTTPGIRVADHGNHSRAIFPTAACENMSKHPSPPLAAAFVFDERAAFTPAPAGIRAVSLDGAPASTGPPGRIAVDRAPPHI